MKKTASLILILTVVKTSFSQQVTVSPTLAKQDYLLKSKHQKTTAWLLLGGGIALSSIGTVIATPKAAEDIGYVALFLPNALAGNPQQEPQNDYSIETLLIVCGATAMLSSIPLFIASGKNKRKAISLSLKNETAFQIYKGSFVYNNIPSFTLKFHL